MGPLIRAINYIADAIKDEFPDVAVCTLAYGSTAAPPLTQARDNVMIQLAPLGADYAHPFTHPTNIRLRDMIKEWGTKCSRLFIWNYLGGFECFLLPFRE